MKKILLISLLLSAIILGQGSGKITGKVTDARTKEILPGANILIQGTNFGTAADNDGNFEITNVPIGTYILRVSFVGYTQLNIPDVIVKTGKPFIIQAELEPQLVETKEVVITAGFFNSEQLQIPSLVTLRKEEIRRFPGGFEDVVRTVSTLPGVAINSSGGRNDLLVRGGGPSENLYIINNIEIPNINHFGSQGLSSGSLSFVNLDFVENVSFSTGGFGARYGDKMSSVLSLDMDKGRQDKIGAKALISATQFGLNVEGPVTSKSNFIFSARKSYLDLIFKAAGLPFVPVYTDFNMIYNYEIDSRDRLFVMNLTAIDNVDRNLSSEENRVKNENLLDNTQYQNITGINFRRIHNNGYADITLNMNLYKFDFSQSDRNQKEYFKSNAKEYEYALKVQRYWNLGKKASLLFGANFKLKQNKNDTFFADTIYNSSGKKVARKDLGIPADTKNETWSRKAAIFVESEINFSSDFTLNLGLRSDIYTFLDKSFYIAPRIGIKYQITPKQAVKFNYGIYYQSPAEVWTINPFNKNLEALKNSMFIAGWDYLIEEDLRLTVEGYYKEYSNLPAGNVKGVTDHIVITNTGGNYGGRGDDFQSFGYINLAPGGKGKSYGAEINLQKKYSEVPLYGQVSLSYGKSELTALNDKVYPNQFDQRFIFNLSAGYKFNEKWEISGKFRYYTGVPFTPVYRPDENKLKPGFIKNEPEEYLSGRLDAGHHLDLRVDRYFNFAGWTLTVYLDIQNVYNFKIPQKPTYDFWDNKVNTTGSIGLLPSIGISAEF